MRTSRRTPRRSGSRHSIVSEESLAPSYTGRRAWHRFWLIDPLDGTKEFIAHIDEFAINIALIEDRRPVMGVVTGPALTVTYFAASGLGAFKRARGGSGQRIAGRPFGELPLKVVGSRFREDEALRSFLRRLGPADCVRMGSALKFCAIAEGSAHLYPQLGPTMGWDTAAGQAILEAAGGAVIDASGADLRYNKPLPGGEAYEEATCLVDRWPRRTFLVRPSRAGRIESDQPAHSTRPW